MTKWSRADFAVFALRLRSLRQAQGLRCASTGRNQASACGFHGFCGFRGSAERVLGRENALPKKTSAKDAKTAKTVDAGVCAVLRRLVAAREGNSSFLLSFSFFFK